MAGGTFAAIDLESGHVQHSLPLLNHMKGRGPVAGANLLHSSGVMGAMTWPETPLGPGWSLSCMAYLDVSTPSNPVLNFARGTRVHFDQGESSAGYFMAVAQETPTTWRVTMQGGDYLFEDPTQDGRARLKSVSDALGASITLHYSATGLLEKLEEANGREMLLVDSDLDGLIDLVRYGSGAPTSNVTLSYANGLLTSYADPSGDGPAWGYDSSGRIEWVEDGFMASSTVANRWEYDYDANGRVEHFGSNATGSPEVSLSYTTGSTTVENAFAQETRYDFDTQGRMVLVEDALGNEIEFVYNADNKATMITDAEDHEWDFEYDSMGRLTKNIAPDGRFTYYQYDTAGRFVEMGDSKGANVTMQYTSTQFPSLPTGFTLPADGQGNSAAQTTLTYYPPTSIHAGLIESLTDANGVRTEVSYNTYGVANELSYGVGGQKPVIQSLTLDPFQMLIVGRTFTPDTSATDPATFPGRPADHSALQGPPTRSMVRSHNWLGLDTGTVATFESMVQPTGWSSPEEAAEIVEQMVFDFGGRLTSYSVSDEQPTIDHSLPPVSSQVDITYYDRPTLDYPYGGRSELGPNAMTRSFTADEVGRMSVVEFGNGHSSTTHYYPDGLVESVVSRVGSNWIRKAYTYSTGNKCTSQKVSFSTNGTTWTEQRRLDWLYDTDGTVKYLLEYHFNNLVAACEYTYDVRKQLVWEKRLGLHSYNRFYAYDQCGNRTDMLILDGSDQIQERREYVYDVSDTLTYLSQANRLMKEVRYDGSNQELLTKWYYYDDTFGNICDVVTREAGSSWYLGTQVVYLEREDSLLTSSASLFLERYWQLDANGDADPSSVIWIRAREIRQSDGDSRELIAERDPSTLELIESPDTRVWTDGAGHSGSPTSDYQISSTTGSRTTLAEFAGALGQSTSSGDTWFAHDLAGNTRYWMNSSGVYHDEVHTAFGERISTGTTLVSRYAGFSGAAGAEEGMLPEGWVRIGARLYDPSTGRWLQSDPIGQSGGMNVYEYVFNSPVATNDPSGLQGPAPQPNYIAEAGYEHNYSAGQTVQYTNDLGTFTVTIPGGPEGEGESPPMVIHTQPFPGQTRPRNTPMPDPSQFPGSNALDPQSLRWWMNSMRHLYYPPYPKPPTAGPAPPGPAEMSLIGRVLLAFCNLSLGLQADHPGGAEPLGPSIRPVRVRVL